MKKFLLSIFAVSALFLGLGALVDRSGAASKSDERALELIRKARLAIGGDAAINGVRSMTIVGRTTKSISIDGVARTETGETEIALQLPDKMMRMVKLGSPGKSGEAHHVITRQMDVVTAGGAKDKQVTLSLDASKADGQSVQRKVMVRKDDGTVVELTGDEAAKWVAEHPMPEGSKVFTVTKKGDGPGEHEIVVLRKGDGDATFTTKDGNTVVLKEKSYAVKSDGNDKEDVVVLRKGDGSTGTFTTKDGNTIKLKEHDFLFRAGEGSHSAARSNEMLRTTLSLLLTAPEGMDVSYTYEGELNVDATACNVVKAEFGGTSYRLFLDRTSNLPVAISYRGAPTPQVIKFDKASAGESKQDVVIARAVAGTKELADIQIKFSDFRNVGGVQLPYRWAQTVGGKDDETFDVTNYEINPANIAEKFQNQKVLVRTAKPDSK